MATPSHTEYWEQFYDDHDVGYEWFLTYDDLVSHFDSLLSHSSSSPVKILHIGFVLIDFIFTIFVVLLLIYLFIYFN